MLKGGGVTSNFEMLRAHLTNTTIEKSLTDPPDFNFFGTGCRLSGLINYTGNRSAHFALDMMNYQSEWKISGYNFEAVPSPVSTTSSFSDMVRAVLASNSKLAGESPTEGDKCPDGYPIKVSAKNIYHVPGGRFYTMTRPVRCFATEADAKAAGFRPSQR
jgi:hypothetical protein